MLTPSDQEAFLSQLEPEDRAQITAMVERESWAVDGDPAAEAALEALAAALGEPGELNGVGAQHGLTVAAGVGCPRALLWLQTLIDRGPEALEAMLAPELGENVNQQTLYQRLVQLARRRILARVLSQPRREALADALTRATQGGGQ